MKTQMSVSDTSVYSGLNYNRLSHAYIVAGSMADTIAHAAVCAGRGLEKPCLKCHHCDKASRHIHPDIIVVDKLPDKREIIVEQLRELKKDVIIVPNEAEKKAYIINNADLMNISAQNAFLQVLEEPPSYVVFILRTDNPAALLPTVRSRCVSLVSRYDPDSPDPTVLDMANDFFSAIKHGSAPLTKFMFRLEKLDKSAFADFIAAARSCAALILKSPSPDKEGLPLAVVAHAERVLVSAREMLDLNVGTGHISGMICADLLSISLNNK
ncbi:MAG: hypothetical protein FWH57_01735 [Oscillospiraceae bacterium]|nr:hypothetical protein [Oscillospiraceae bacterium]